MKLVNVLVKADLLEMALTYIKHALEEAEVEPLEDDVYRELKRTYDIAKAPISQ